MTTVDIYWDDLTEKKRQELYELLGDNGNYDVFPITSINVCVPFIDDENKLILIERNGERMTVPFYELTSGDYLVDHCIVVGFAAHKSGDASCDSWLFYDDDGNGWFPEDCIGR